MDPGSDVVVELLVLLGIGVDDPTDLAHLLILHVASAELPISLSLPRSKVTLAFAS
jgi:hypothetical protein